MVYLTEKEIAKRMNVSLTTVRNWRLTGIGPPWISIGCGKQRISPRYPEDSFNAWVKKLTSGGE